MTPAEAQYDVDADSWRFELHTTTAPDDLAELYFTGAFDRKRRLGRFEITDHEDASAYTKCDIEARSYPEETLVIGEDVYSRWLTWGQSFWVKDDGWPGIFWLHPDVVRAIAPFPLGRVDPTDVVERLRSLDVDLATVGRAEVQDVETTHYRATLEVSRLLQRLPVTVQPRPAIVDHWRDHPQPASVDIWVDDADRVRKMELRLNVDENGQLGDVMTYTLKLFGFGVAVDVNEPKKLGTMEDYYRAQEELYPDDDRCDSPEYRLRPEEPYSD